MRHAISEQKLTMLFVHFTKESPPWTKLELNWNQNWLMYIKIIFLCDQQKLSHLFKVFVLIIPLQCLKRLADTERLIENLTVNMQNMDTPMKVVHTRLDNRNRRLNVDNCRDRAHVGLVDEVRNVEEATLALSVSLKEAEDTKSALIQTRALLERELNLKRRTLQLDKERCTFFRSQFPSATALSGYI